MRFSLAASVALMLVAVGCASAPPAPTPTPLPMPATFHVSADVILEVPGPLAVETGLPNTMKATLDASAHSEALSVDPDRSRHQGHMTLIVTDGTGEHTLAKVNIDVSGDSDGSPTEGLGQAIERFLNAASMISNAVPKPLTGNSGAGGARGNIP